MNKRHEHKNGLIRKPSQKAKQRDEIVSLLKGLKDILENSPMGIKREDLEETEDDVAAMKEQIEIFENRVKFIEGRDLGDVDKLRSDFEELKKIVLYGGKSLPVFPMPKIPWWKRIFFKRHPEGWESGMI